jgi:hypothetical protein
MVKRILFEELRDQPREFLNQLDSTPEAKTFEVLDRKEDAGR